jgi:hypothetical protein
MDFDTVVRSAIYDHIVATTRPPSVAEVAGRVGSPVADVKDAYQRLFGRRTLVLAADGETIVMAPPFAGAPTQHRVRVGEREYFANCSWDALGVAAAIKRPAVVTSRCEQTLEPIVFNVGEHGPDAEPCVAHFAVPAAQWWKDIVFT